MRSISLNYLSESNIIFKLLFCCNERKIKRNANKRYSPNGQLNNDHFNKQFYDECESKRNSDRKSVV